MAGAPELFILRHGETAWNAEGRMQGALNSPLTEIGIDHARRQGQLLADLDLAVFDIRVSPQGRAFQTAAIALAGRARNLRTDDRLREIGVGKWAGRLRSELSPPPGVALEDTPDGPIGLYEYAPGGEGFAALRARCADLLADLAGPTILVTHGITSRMIRAVVLGLSSAELGDLPGGQGVVHHLKDGVARVLE